MGREKKVKTKIFRYAEEKEKGASKFFKKEKKPDNRPTNGLGWDAWETTNKT